MFREMMNDIVCLIKPDGQKFDNIRAQVDPNMIFIDDASLPIEEGDKIQRILPNKLIENYVVIDRGFYEAFGPIKAHYQAKVRKESSEQLHKKPREVTYILNGDNSRININSHDASLNVVVSQENLFDELKNILCDQLKDETLKQQLLKDIDQMEHSKGTKNFNLKYQQFIANAAQHMGIVAPFIPMLTQLLSQN